MNLTLKEKIQTYMISTVQVSNNRQLNTLITVHREVGRDSPKKRKRKKQCLHIVHTDKGKLIIVIIIIIIIIITINEFDLL